VVLLGIHHITAFAANAQRNLDFYTQFLGLRLVKQTVNFDDPATYHFYFGDATGTPGTLLTFFPWPTAAAGRRGTGLAETVSFSVPKNALPAWIDRAARAAIAYTGPETRFDEGLITFRDPAGMPFELVAAAPESDRDAIVRLHSTTLRELALEPTAHLLTEILGFTKAGTEGDRTRFEAGDNHIDLIAAPGVERAKLSSGMIHHIAWRVADEETQNTWRAKLIAAGLRVTRVMDRKYFRSIYFREPGGVLFEIATERPGFLVDESAAGLGHTLQLPPWLESIRESIERRLPPVTIPEMQWTR
jgi:glyoxalase family protein